MVCCCLHRHAHACSSVSFQPHKTPCCCAHCHTDYALQDACTRYVHNKALGSTSPHTCAVLGASAARRAGASPRPPAASPPEAASCCAVAHRLRLPATVCSNSAATSQHAAWGASSPRLPCSSAAACCSSSCLLADPPQCRIQIPLKPMTHPLLGHPSSCPSWLHCLTALFAEPPHVTHLTP